MVSVRSVSLDPAVERDRRRRLLAWYRAHARRLPWRASRDPYRVWVSEAMLQQTQVATALPYYERFLERFPTVAALAEARPADVLAAWSGLGYYRRARHLHEAARTVVREHRGVVPGDPDAFAALPGVGRYTTGAVLSIAFDTPLPVLDGNVARVLARWFALPMNARTAAGARSLWEIAAALVPMRRPGDWNQALMELGATICTPRSPRCHVCPVAALCRARRLGRVEAYPPVARRRATEHVRRAVALLERQGRVLLERRDGALLAGLWEPPGVELVNGADAGVALRAKLRALGVHATLGDSGRRVRHTITHRAITVEVWRGRLARSAARHARLRWIAPARPAVALTALARKLIARD